VSNQLLFLALLYLIGALGSGFSVASQAALHHINRARLRQLVDQGESRSQAVLRILEEPNLLVSGVALAGTISMVVATLAAASLVQELWSSGPALAAVVAVLLFVLALMIQVATRTLAMHYPEAWALRLGGPLHALVRALWPVLAPLLAVERWLLRAVGLPAAAGAPAAAEDELRLLVQEENGVFEKDEREMIQGIFEMSDRPVREVMVPRIDVTALPLESTVREATDLAIDSGFSRLPVYQENLDNIVGILVVKDLLAELRAGRMDAPVRPLVRPAYYVPETKKIDELLDEMQERHVQMAIVVDEYGGTAGIITLEDLVEEIVGEIQDEYDTEEALYERINEHEAIFDARASIHDVNDIMELHLADDEFDTLGGLVYDRLGKVPVPGDEVRVDGCIVSVLSTHGRRIAKVRIRTGVNEPPVSPAA